MAKVGGDVNGVLAAHPLPCGMAKDDPTREQRLAEQLRQNLRRRKAQGRALDEGEPVTPPEAPSRP